MTYFAFAEHLHAESEISPASADCEYCGAALKPGTGLTDDVTQHTYCSVNCASLYLREHTDL